MFLNGLPADLAQDMFDNLKYPVDLEEEITGDILAIMQKHNWKAESRYEPCISRRPRRL